MYSLSESSELDIVTSGGEPREDSESGVTGVGRVSGDGGADLSKGKGSGESGEGSRQDSGRDMLAGETVDKEADSMVYDTEATEVPGDTPGDMCGDRESRG